MIPRHDVLIVGAGVVGCSVAFQRSLGVTVELLHRDDALRLAPFVLPVN